MTEHLARYVKDKAQLLEEVGIDQARAEIELILCHILDCDRLKLYMDGIEVIDDRVRRRVDDIIEKRRTRYPLQFILNESWFYGRRFYVTPDVMAPTPETEMLCEHAIRFLNARSFARARVLDLGIGSGVISVTLAKEVADIHIVALDISSPALKIAKHNAKEHGVYGSIELRKSDLFSALRPYERFELIVSNPPYIAQDEYEELPPEVLADPMVSLVGGEDGLEVIRQIIGTSPDHLAPKGILMFEIGVGQAEAVAEIVERDGRYREFSILRDLNSRDRLVLLSMESHSAA